MQRCGVAEAWRRRDEQRITGSLTGRHINRRQQAGAQMYKQAGARGAAFLLMFLPRCTSRRQVTPKSRGPPPSPRVYRQRAKKPSAQP
ncbi:hypothetical protein PLESTB_000673800 [Pleodorina starrii]|uniref:Uncharacterized protein n=1 Tax=Pleodorina starrii TaxID=330485 RepID=A0A9W6BJ95_9CHLO|nr:hypothetical protein PLESTB_000673800 [Pleodorina starrii]